MVGCCLEAKKVRVLFNGIMKQKTCSHLTASKHSLASQLQQVVKSLTTLL